MENAEDMKNEEDLERFKLLLKKIDPKECLSYHNLYLKQEPESKHDCAGMVFNQNKTPSPLFGKTYRRRKHGSLIPAISSGQSNLPETAPKPVVAPPDSGESIILTGTASSGKRVPPIGMVDIGINDAAYFFQVALPGVRRDFCNVSCEVESDGKVHIRGSTGGGKIIKKRSRDFHMKTQNLCPPGPFTVSFELPGPVDPRLFSPHFRDDGILEAVIVKVEQK